MWLANIFPAAAAIEKKWLSWRRSRLLLSAAAAAASRSKKSAAAKGSGLYA